MAESVEAALTRALNRAAEAAPEPGPELATSLVRRYGQGAEIRSNGRGRLMVVAAALAVLVVLAGGITAVRAFHDDPETTKPVTRPIKPVDPVKPRVENTDYADGAAVTDVWPTALRHLPSTLPDAPGQSLGQIDRILPDGRVIVGGPGMPISSVDPRTGDQRAIGPDNQDYFTIGQPVNARAEKWVVWGVQVSGGKAEIWRAPIQGGRAAKVRTLDPIPGVRMTELRLTVVDDMVLIDPYPGVNGHGNFGVRWMPLDGSAAPTVISGSRDYRYLQWPWFGSTEVMNNSTIWNAETGEWRRSPLRWKSLSCSVSWCVGLDGDAVMVARHDGSDVRRLTLEPTQSGQRIVADRFVFGVFMDGGTTVYDAEAGKYLTAPAPAGSEQWDSAQLSGGVSTNPFYVWTVTAPGKPNSLRILQLGEMR